jgi:predicted enzyme related to lactoylglutathione lyase
MAEATTATRPGTKEHLLESIEALDGQRVAALSFYANFAGFGREQQRGNLGHYVMREGRGGAGLLPIENAPVESNWLPYVRVEDAAELASRTRDLGGEVLLAPSPEVRNGELAIVADPSGAALALVEWTQ